MAENKEQFQLSDGHLGQKHMFLKGLSLLFLGFGIFVLMQVILPLASFKFLEISAFDDNTRLVNPVSGGSSSLGFNSGDVSIEEIGNFPAFISNSQVADLPYKEFKLTIRSLNIFTLPVKVASNDFDNGLAQLPGTALPGERGNVFISAHSSLPNNLLAQKIKPYFVDLPNIKKGDEIVLEALGQQFRYSVESLKVVNPSDVGVINPPDSSGRYVTLMTCVPPGFNTKRLIVLAKLK